MSNSSQKTLIMDKIDSRFCVNIRRSKHEDFYFSNIFHKIVRINVELNFALNLLLAFLKKYSKKSIEF